MENADNPLSTPQFLIIVLVIAGYIYAQIRYSEAPVVKRNLKKYLILRNLEDIYRPCLSQYFTFYNSLGSKDKLLFERRVQKFIDMKEFISRSKKVEVTPEMKAMIAGSAIQLTFGYPDVYFTHFWRILIYSDSYYSTITHKYHLGEVNINGIIVLSWKSFKDGFINPSDGRNLGLHEMAHMLRLINIIDNDEYDFYDRLIMDEFEKEAHTEMLKAHNSPGTISLFRNYYIPDIHEFFSVSVECFFEKALEFRNYNPKLYTLLSRILKIDPIAIYASKESQNLAS